MIDPVVPRFSLLFGGRLDAWGTEDGGCVRVPGGYPPYEAHLDGSGDPIGIYPIIREVGHVEFGVVWGACDIDYDDIQEAINFHDLLAQVGIPSYIERSRSKGFHVWVFVENWISAETMRHALLVVRDFLKMSAREIYPKQTSLKEGELGNYLRLPYPGVLAGIDVDSTRRTMLKSHSHEPMSLTYFLAAVAYADPADLEKLASRYTPPVVSEVRWQRENFDTAKHDHIARHTLNRLNHALAWHVYNRGALDGNDRSSTLMRLANMAMTQGATMDECFSIVWSADSKAHSRKYVDRHDGEERIRQLVERVYISQGSH